MALLRSISALNPLLEIPIEVHKAILGLLPHSKHLGNRTFTHHESQKPVKLLFLNESSCTLGDLALSEVEGVIAIEGTEQSFTRPAEGCSRVFLRVLNRVG